MFYVTAPISAFKNHAFGWRARLYTSRWFFPSWGAYPHIAGQKDYAKSLAHHIALLKDGHSICIFPEGGLTKDGNLQQAHGDVSYLSYTTHVPIIPVAIVGSYRLGFRQFMSRRVRVTVVFGEPQYGHQHISNMLPEPVHFKDHATLTERADHLPVRMNDTLPVSFWNAYFHDYDVLNELHSYQSLMEHLENALKIQPGESVLDFGSGTGNFARRLRSDAVGQLVCFDMSPEGLALCRQKSPWSVIVQGNAQDTLPFADNRFDAIVSSNMLYTIPRRERARIFKELYRVCRPAVILRLPIIWNLSRASDLSGRNVTFVQNPRIMGDITTNVSTPRPHIENVLLQPPY